MTEASPGPTGKDLLKAVGLIWGFSLLVGIGVGVFRLDLSNPAAIAVMVLLDGTATFLLVRHFACAKHARSWREGLGLVPIPKRLLMKSVLIGVLGALIGALLLHAFAEGKSSMAKLTSKPGGLMVVTLIGLLLPLVEEMYYRGFILPVLSRKLGPAAGVALVSLWFVGVHVSQLAGDWIGLPILLVMGTIWTLQRMAYGVLTPSLACHWTYNACLMIISWTT